MGDDELFGEYIGRKIGGCRVAKRVGGGGMGVVFEARHLALNKRVALKLLLPALAADKTFIKRFVSEARMAAQVEHPNVVQVMNVGRDGEVYFMVMQYIDGQSLRERMAKGKVAPEEAARYVMQAAQGLAAAHKRGIIHRDVKPENILIDSENAARVVDMGLSKSLTSEDSAMLTAPGTAMGTPNYISPEQATEARTVDARTDIYSLGASFYHLLSGTPPFDGPSALSIMTKHLSEPLVPLSEKVADVPPALARAVERMMAKDPEERFQTMDQVVTALDGFLKGSSGDSATLPAAGAIPVTRVPTAAAIPTAPTIEKPATVRASGRKWPFVVLGAGGTLAVIIVLAIMAAARDPGRKSFNAAQAFERVNPRAFEQAEGNYEAVKQKFPGGQWYAKAADAIQKLKQRRIAESHAELEKIKGQAQPLERAGRWAEAAELWKGFAALQEFSGTEAARLAAGRAGEAGAKAELADFKKKAKPLYGGREWAKLEKLAADFPAGLADTEAGKHAADLRVRAHVARRAQELIAHMADPSPKAPAKMGKYIDPKKPPGQRFLGWAWLTVIRGMLIQAKKFDAYVDLPPDIANEKAVVPVTIHIVHPGPRGRQERKLEKFLWKRVDGEWYLGDNKKAGSSPDRHPGPRSGPGRRLRRP